MATVKSIKARLDFLERLVPRKAIPLYITAQWDGELWTAKILGHKDLTAAKMKTLRRLIKRKHGKNTLIVMIRKQQELPEMDGDGIPLSMSKEGRGKEKDDEDETPNFEQL